LYGCDSDPARFFISMAQTQLGFSGCDLDLARFFWM